jgi:Xylanase inhibitor N-terminal
MSHSSCVAKQCPIGMSYMEGSSWSGVEVEDMVSLGGEDADEEAYPLRFGCQRDITGLFEDQIPDGIFGMNKEVGSAISQWSNLGYLDKSAFSLCYNVREDVKEKSGVMVLGGADERLHEKPMVFAKDIGVKNYEVRIINQGRVVETWSGFEYQRGHSYCHQNGYGPRRDGPGYARQRHHLYLLAPILV